jgi:hypothetical protein
MLSIICASRYFASEGNIKTANHFTSVVEAYEDDNDAPTVEGYISLARGELLCCEGKFSESLFYFEKSADSFFEAAKFKCWAEAIKHMITANVMLGQLESAANFLEECSKRAEVVRSFEANTIFGVLKCFVCVEMGELKRATEHSAVLKKAEDAPIHQEAAIAFLQLSEGFDVAHGVEAADAAITFMPTFIRDWTWGLPLYWANMTYYMVSVMGKQSGKLQSFNNEIAAKMAVSVKKMNGLAKKFKGLQPMAEVCNGLFATVRGSVSKACQSSGSFHKAVTLSEEMGCVLIEARSKILLATLSREPLASKLSMGIGALDVFRDAKAAFDHLETLVLLSQLDPKNTEFKEMARMTMRRKSSSRKSKGSAESIITDIQSVEDVPLSGRKQELTLLIKAANALRTLSGGGADKTIVLEAAGGMGKSALLRTFMKDVTASMAGVQLHLSATSQFEANTPFFIWKKVFEGVLGLFSKKVDAKGRRSTQVIEKEVLLAKLAELIGPENAKAWHPLLNPLLPFKFPDTPESGALSSAAALSKSLDFYYEILLNSDAKMLIALEDAHWCDELSWDLIERCHPLGDVLVVMTTRPNDGEGEGVITNNQSGGETDSSLREFWELEGIEKVTLGTLDESALREHIAGLLEVDNISENLLRLVENRTGGNLLYVLELVSSLIESGMLLYDDKSVDLKNDVDELVVPDNVQAVIASRLAGLSANQQSLLQTASVIGREFTLPLVIEVHPASDMLTTVSSDMQEIVRKRLVERIVGSGGNDSATLQFSHKFVQESIYQSCLVSTRKQVHRSIAKYLELDKAEQLSNYYGTQPRARERSERKKEPPQGGRVRRVLRAGGPPPTARDSACSCRRRAAASGSGGRPATITSRAEGAGKSANDVRQQPPCLALASRSCANNLILLRSLLARAPTTSFSCARFSRARNTPHSLALPSSPLVPI